MSSDSSPPDDPRLPDLRAPTWVERVKKVRFIELFEKYRQRVVHSETGLPFEPSVRPSAFSLENLAFQTRGPLRIALKVFFPTCALFFGLSFLWDFHSLIRSCSVAGMIGFGTNWVAINMLFWPRESRPVFGHGLIPSQRDQLVDKVAAEVLENLINEELILRKIDETAIIRRFSEALIAKLHQVVRDPEFKQDMRQMVLTYVGEIASDQAFRTRLLNSAEERLEEFAGTRFRSWLVDKLKEIWRPPLAEVINHEIERLEHTVDGGLAEIDGVMEQLPKALAKRQEAIDKVLTTMLVGFVREVDVRAIVFEQLETVTTEQLETGFREFSDDKLSYITLLGGIFGVIGGSVIVWPLPAIGVLLLALAFLAVLDVLVYKLMRTSWWPWQSPPTKRPAAP